MDILFVDYIWQPGHVNFNNIHIEAIKRSGANLKLVLYKSMKEKLPYSDEEYALILPDFLKMRRGHPLLNRLGFLMVLFLIKVRLKLSLFNYIYISSFDEITIGILPLGKKMLLVAHDNAKGFSYKIKKLFLHRLMHRCTFLVFNKQMASAFHKNNVHNVKIISHGCIEQIGETKSDNNKKHSMVIFQASSKIDEDFYKKIIQNHELHFFLKRNNILLVLRNCENKKMETENMKIINNYLSTDEYKKLMSTSDVILLAYPATFRNQVSGVSFECVALNKNLVIYNNPSLYYCREYYDYDPIFSDYDSFKNLLLNLLKGRGRCLITPDKLIPDYKSVFN